MLDDCVLILETCGEAVMSKYVGRKRRLQFEIYIDIKYLYNCPPLEPPEI